MTGGYRKGCCCAARGIGDILRVTPLVRVFQQLGYDVDLCIEPDHSGVAELLQRAPEVRRVLLKAPDQNYDVAAFTYWSAPRQDAIRADRKLAFARNEWLTLGDSRCLEKIARDVGWTGAMPNKPLTPSPLVAMTERPPVVIVAAPPGVRRRFLYLIASLLPDVRKVADAVRERIAELRAKVWW